MFDSSAQPVCETGADSVVAPGTQGFIRLNSGGAAEILVLQKRPDSLVVAAHHKLFGQGVPLDFECRGSRLKVAISGSAVALLPLVAAFWATKNKMNQGMIATNDRVLKAENPMEPMVAIPPTTPAAVRAIPLPT